MDFYHEPVLLEEVLAYLRLGPGVRVLDLTLGGGGHAEAILGKIGPTGALVGVDCDDEALKAAGQRLAGYSGFQAFLGNFGEWEDVGVCAQGFDAVLMDLGVSSAQLDRGGRGFSFRCDAPLDMRLDRRLSTTAADLVKDLSERELARLFRQFGEEPFAGPIARKIVQTRARAAVNTTQQLADLVREAVPARVREGRLHPATRVFQALRMVVNSELEALEAGLDSALRWLRPGARLVVLSYHSLEDRLVKQFMVRHSGQCVCPRGLPRCVCSPSRKLKILTRRPVVAGSLEVERNPRARSAKLRAAERTQEAWIESI